MIAIDTQFDGGSIEVIRATGADDIQLRLRKDRQSDLAQWFYFRVQGPPRQSYRIAIIDLKASAYPEGWQEYRALASTDRQTWVRVPTEFDGDTLTISHTPGVGTVWYAYAVPYSYERQLDRIARAQSAPRCAVSIVGRSVEGRAIHLLQIGESGEGKRRCWFIARQHSGETMAEWFIEGLVDRLCDANDDLTRRVLDRAVFYIVPNMNPDGSVGGHERMNALGVDLNRQWLEPTPEQSPEVLCVRRRMEQVGVDFFLDAHGDENIPYVFLAARPFSDRVELLRARFRQAFLAATPEFQTEQGYTVDPATPLNMTVAVNYVGKTFDCVSFTLEMPFKDNLRLPDPRFGWSAERSKKLGADVLSPLDAVLDELR